jgi:hypothetical protein
VFCAKAGAENAQRAVAQATSALKGLGKWITKSPVILDSPVSVSNYAQIAND